MVRFIVETKGFYHKRYQEWLMRSSHSRPEGVATWKTVDYTGHGIRFSSEYAIFSTRDGGRVFVRHENG